MKKQYSSILVIIIGFLALHIWFNIDWLLYLALAIAVLASISDYTAKLIADGWFGLSKILGWVMSRVLLSIIYFTILTPLGLVQRISRGKSKDNFRNADKASFYITRKYEFTASDLDDPW